MYTLGIYNLIDRAVQSGLNKVIEDIRDAIILEALEQRKGSKMGTAKMLQISTCAVTNAIKRKEGKNKWQQLKLLKT